MREYEARHDQQSQNGNSLPFHSFSSLSGVLWSFKGTDHAASGRLIDLRLEALF
jgi:hypothetical protein